MIENYYDSQKHNLITIDWLKSDQDSGLRGNHFGCERDLDS